MAKKEVNEESNSEEKQKKKSKATLALLLDNTIALQKTMVSLATELKSLNEKFTALFTLFEKASNAFTEKGGTAGDIDSKLNEIIEQNKTLAEGLLLLEKIIREKESETNIQKTLTKSTKHLRKAEEEYEPQPLPEFTF